MGIGLSGSGKERYVYHLWAWWPSWSRDQDNLNQLSSLYPKKSLHGNEFNWFSGFSKNESEKSHINNNMVANTKIILSVTYFQALANI